jgi:signal-transduction protein with cAMP-binding, CBS, and nucleotidyltransferase domain
MLIAGTMMNAEDLSRMMSSGALIATWGAAELQDLLERAALCAMKKGDVLLHQGDAGDYLIILLDGTIRVSMVASNGREIILDYLEPGSVVGEVAARPEPGRARRLRWHQPRKYQPAARLMGRCRDCGA